MKSHTFKNAKNGQLASFWKTEAYAQTMSILIGQKLVENATIETSKWDIFGVIFQQYAPPSELKNV